MKSIYLLAVLGAIGCKDSKGVDEREFASSRFNITDETGEPPVVAGDDAVVDSMSADEFQEILKDNLDKVVTQQPPPNPPAPPTPPNPPVPPTPPAPKPELPAELKAKLAKCAPQWENIVYDKNTLIDIREVKIDASQLNSSRIQVSGDKPEVVFVSMSSSQYISQVELSLQNPKALYCVDVEAVHSVECLDLSYVCGSKLGTTQIEAAKVKNVTIKEFCPQPPAASVP